jgi:enoyl-CoA hydratase
MADPAKVLTSRLGRTFVITINRPEVRNCVDGETAALLHRAWIEFRDDDDLFVAILTGAGEAAFCAGADLKNLPSLGAPGHSSRHRARWFVHSGPGYMGYTRQTDIFKPILAAVNGYAFAGGLELACLADMRIAAQTAEFGCLERRWNVPLCDGGTQRLPHIVGLGHAMELILTGKRIDAREAYRIGLVNEIVPPGRALDRCLSLAEEIAAFPQGAVRSDKQAVMTGLGRPLEDGLRLEAQVAESILETHDIREGATAFAEKRKGTFEHD